MNHEELLANIDANSVPFRRCIASLNKALRAVVELHKPCRIDKDMTYCEGCSNSAFFPWEYCPTIEAIKKALS